MKPTVAVAIADPRRAGTWLAACQAAMPDFEVRALEDMPPATVDFAIVWGRPTGLDRCANLRAILSLGAGVDHVLADPALATVPVVRMVEPGLTQGMREYVLLHVLRHHRRMQEIEVHQRRQEWLPIEAPLAQDRRVGLMGLGVLGRDAAQHLAAIGFQVAAWGRRRQTLPGVQVFVGREELPAFLARTDILVCLLPLTPETADILDRELFARLPRGAAVINAARGGHLVEADLLAALESGQLSGATLDAFREEPLPQGHAFWLHEKITVTPHNASLTRLESGALSLAQAIRQLIAGERPQGLVDRLTGY